MTGTGELSLFVRQVRELLRGPASTCTPATSVAEAAGLMHQDTAVIVLDGDGAPLGIVTDRDLRIRIVAARRDAAATAASDVMSSPVVTIGSGALAFEALLEMTRREIHHLVVVEDGRLVGVLASDDVVGAQAVHPVSLAREIARAPSREALARLAGSVTALVQRLVADGAGAGEIAHIVAELNDRIVARVLAQAESALVDRGQGPPPVAYGWLVFGSEGRREQTLRTDQDNGLVYGDTAPDQAEPTARYFTALADEAVAGLLAVGFPPCPAGAMASNPRWCQPLATWTAYFRDWLAHPTHEHVLAASMYFDLRSVVGAPELGDSLAALVQEEAPRQRRFLTAMAADVVDRRLPLGPLGGLRVPWSGARRGTLDLKGAGGLQLVGAGRVHALELGLRETGTIERFARAGAHGLYTPAEVAEIADAHDDLLRMRLVHQLDCRRQGLPPDNRVNVRRLSHRNQVLLQEALRMAGRVQGKLRERFATDYAV
jgi:CBS domain-containing protein